MVQSEMTVNQLLAWFLIRLIAYVWGCLLCLTHCIMGVLVVLNGGDGWPQMLTAMVGVCVLYGVFESFACKLP
jgi:hypothetical protein